MEVENLEIRRQVKTIQTNSIVEIGQNSEKSLKDSCDHSNSSKRLSTNSGVKNS